MRSNYNQFTSPQFSILSESQLEEIHMTSLEILRLTGVRFHHEESLQLLSKAGCLISDGNLVKFPAHTVENAIRCAPSRVVLCDSNGKPAMKLEGNRAYFGTGSDTLHILDPYTGSRRPFNTEDLCNIYRLCDALPNIHFQMSAGIPSDAPQGISHYLWQCAKMFENTAKPIVFVCNDYADCAAIIEMASIVAGGREELRLSPNILLYSEPTSPLQQSKTSLEKLLLMAENSLPVVHSPAPMMGATAPIKIAGGLAMSNAEVLSALTLHQLKNPGAPFVYGAGLQHMDMAAMQTCYSSPEFELVKATVAQIARYYGLPSWSYAGCTDSKVLDAQAVAESMQSVLMAQLGGANLVHDVGYMESGLMTSPELIAITDELIAMTNHIIKGIEVTDETLSLDVINEVGPGGNYLEHPQTEKYFRDFWYPTIIDRSRYESWVGRGGLSMDKKINLKVRDIIENYQPETITKNKLKKITAVLENSREMAAV